MTLLLMIVLNTSAWPDSIPSFHLEFDPEQWEYACDNYWADIYVPAELTCGGYSFPCQFRIRGATSRSYPKKSIKIELPEGTFLFGHDEFNMNAEFLDKTRLRELLSFLYYSETGQTVSDVNLVEVVFNGETQGAYVSVQDVDGAFLENTTLPDEAVIYKCADRYTTLDRVHELEPYSKKTKETQPWDDLILLMYWLAICPEELFPEQLNQRFHYDDLVSCVATNVLIGHGSTYYHNYHLVLDRTGTEGPWRYITWDMDRTWSKYGPEFPYHRNSSNNGNRRNTLIWRMWCNHFIRQDLIREIHSQFPEYLSFAGSGIIDSLASAVAPLVEADPFREYSMDNFWGEIETLKNWPQTRYDNLLNQFDSWPLPFRIFPLEPSGTSLEVSWQHSGSGSVWRVDISPDSLFSSPEDIVFSLSTSDTSAVIPGTFTGNDLWLQVFATRNGEEQRASNGPIRPVAAPGLATTGSVVISEINYQSSPQFDPGDWFEVVNTEEIPLSLAGWSVRDGNPENLTTLGDLVIQPGEAMVFAADSFLFTGVFSTIPPPNQGLNFNLSADGERIALFDPVSRMTDEVEYSPAPPWPDASGNGSTLILTDLFEDNTNPLFWIAGPFGGTPFGHGEWNPDWPRYGAVGVKVLGPMPSAGNTSLLLTVISSVVVEICLYDIVGRAVLEPVLMDLQAGSHTVTLETENLPAGVYFAAVRNMGYLQAIKVTLIGDR